jgi:hypothetical protein
MKSKTKTAKAKRGFGVLDREKARKDAVRAVKLLRKVSKDAGADLSVNEVYPARLNYELGHIEMTLNEMLPPNGAEPKPTLRGLFEEDEPVSAEGQGT